MTVAWLQLFEGKGKVGRRCRLQRVGKAVQSWRKPARQPVRNHTADGARSQRIKRARSAWELCVRLVRGLAICCLVLGGTFVGAGLASVASSGAAMAQAVNADRRRGQPPRRSRRPSAPISRPVRAGGSDPPRSTTACRRSTPPACSRTCTSVTCRRPPGRRRGREPGDQPASPSRATRRPRTNSSRPRCSRSRAARCRSRRCRPTSSASSKSTAAPAASTSRSIPKIIELPNNRVEPGVRDQAKARRPASRTSTSSACTPSRTAACAT